MEVDHHRRPLLLLSCPGRVTGSRNAGFERAAQSWPEINYTLQANQIRDILTLSGFIVISGYALERA